MSGENSNRTESRLIFNQFGNPEEVLEVEHSLSQTAPPAKGDVRVRILAAPVNPADLNTVEGTYGIKPTLPSTPGIEGCGRVEASGSPDFQPGDLVIFLRRASTWSSQVTAPAESLFKLPTGIDPLQAAMLKVNPATAWQLLHGFEKPNNGAAIVQNAGNSAVGQCVIQIARDLGITTISFVRREELIHELRALGGDHVFVDDEEGHAAAKEVLGGANAALAFNAVGGDSALRLMKLLRESGTHITYGAMGRRPVSVPNGLLIFRDIQIRGLWVSRWIDNAPLKEIRAVYSHLAKSVAAGKIVQTVDSTFPLASFKEAFARLEAPDRSGKILFAS